MTDVPFNPGRPHWQAVVLAAAMLVGAGAVRAQARDLTPPASQGPLPTNTFFGLVYTGPSASGNLLLELLGYRSLDGVNPYRDQFVLLHNAEPVFGGSFNLGGGGESSIDFNPLGASAGVLTRGTAGAFGETWSGGRATVSFDNFVLTSGDTLTLGYASVAAPYFGFQGTDDEAWGLDSLRFTPNIPEPGSLSMWLVTLAAAALWRAARVTAPARP